ncbi:MAG: hypothetical protein R3F60_13170 [bacterium]
MTTLRTLAAAAIATITAVPAAQAAALCSNGVCRYTQSKDAAYGNNNFGASYDFDFKVYNKAGDLADLQDMIDEFQLLADTLPAPLNAVWQIQVMTATQLYDTVEDTMADDRFYVGAEADVEATVFSKDKSLLDVDGYSLLNDGAFRMGLTAKVLGGSIALPSFDSTEIDLFEQSLTFFSASTTYMAGPVPITVRGEVTGTLGLKGKVTASGGMNLGLTPHAALTAEASVGVGVACASAGVRGSVDLVSVNVPSTLKLTSQACGTRVDVSSSLTLSSMDGSVEVYAEACGLEWSKELVSWTGTSSPPATILNKYASCL